MVLAFSTVTASQHLVDPLHKASRALTLAPLPGGRVGAEDGRVGTARRRPGIRPPRVRWVSDRAEGTMLVLPVTENARRLAYPKDYFEQRTPFFSYF